MLQRRLEAKLADCEKLQESMAKVSAEKAAAHEAGMLGIRAAKAHLGSLQAELATIRGWRQEQEMQERELPLADGSSEDAPPPEADAMAEAHQEVKNTRMRDLRLGSRTLRHEVARWKHQVALFEGKRPKQEEEITRLKGELTHTLDVLQSTRHALKHHEVEREFSQQAAAPAAPAPQADDAGALSHVPLHGGGHGSVEACAERKVREKAEDRNTRLSAKAKRLSGVVAAQELLIQRLERQLIQEEHVLGQKDSQLSNSTTRVAQLKGILRKKSNEKVAAMLGMVPQKPERSASVPPGGLASADAYEYYGESPPRSNSAPRLPPI